MGEQERREPTDLKFLLHSPSVEKPFPEITTEEGQTFLCTERPPEIEDQVYDLSDLIFGMEYYLAVRGGINNTKILRIQSGITLTFLDFPRYDKFASPCAVFQTKDLENNPYPLISIAVFGLAPYSNKYWEQDMMLIQASKARKLYPHLLENKKWI